MTALHLDYCKQFGISKQDIEATEESLGKSTSQAVWRLKLTSVPACTAYSRLIIDIGHSEDWLALQICFAPCLVGYAMIAKRLSADPSIMREGNVYSTWVENYIAEDYVTAVKAGSGIYEAGRYITTR